MVTDGRSARDELWRRYDAGSLSAPELDARLVAVDRAGDTDALQRAIDGPVRLPGSRRRIAVAGGVGVLVLALVVVPLLLGGGSGGAQTRTTSTDRVNLPPLLPVLPPAPDCPELQAHLARLEAAGSDDPAANPALLSDPPALPDGYEVGDQEDVVPGTDPDVAMGVAAGDPPPVEILARILSGPLNVTMRTFRHASVEEAIAAGESVAAQGLCTFGLEPFEVPDHPELIGSVVSGPIPTTAFVSFRLGDRRFNVAVAVATGSTDAEGEQNALEAARQLAGTIAALELDFARTAPP